eukprot:CAMPEP_0179262658 /NCGR_PEP_ID=MMETSP0797-20121207/27479_1 /TAXON_ID=47934 /ORGANISM="Dinophysis acuminata, Strain DAEP01" /LENGTH=232 /DNA_ID=CAMNT_0020970797 /DNA_START=29 /DNA_END=723 /DNA_ORIENTATION=-
MSPHWNYGDANCGVPTQRGARGGHPAPAGFCDSFPQVDENRPAGGRGPTPISPLIKACAHKGDVTRAEKLLELMEVQGQPLSVDAFNSVIHSCARAGDTAQAERHLRRMEASGFAPNVVTYNLVISAYAEQGNLSQAVMLFCTLLEKGITPNCVTYGTVCKVLARRGDVRQIEEIMVLLEDSGVPLNEYFFASLISACGTVEPPDTCRAERAFRDLVCRGLRPHCVRRVLTR